MSDHATRRAIEALNRLEVPYMIVGSFSSNVYGTPRSTKDADFVLETEEKIDAIGAALAPTFVREAQIGFETKFMTTKYVFRHNETNFTLEFFILSKDPHDQERFARRRVAQYGSEPLYVPAPEDVVIQKLRWRREKDLSDVRDVLEVSGEGLDWGYIHTWCERHGTRDLLDELRREAEEGV